MTYLFASITSRIYLYGKRCFKPIYEELVQKDMDELSLEMQMHFEQIHGDELKRLLIEIVKKFGEFDPTEFVIDLAPKIFARLDRKGELEEYLNKRSGNNK